MNGTQAEARYTPHYSDDNKQIVRSVTVRELSVDDYDQIAGLESRHALETRRFEEWAHLWDENPAYRNLSNTWPRGWVLESGENRVVGYLGNIPLLYELDGDRIIAAASHAWVVDSCFRNYSILLLDRCFKQQGVDLLLCTSANRQSSSVIEMFNSSRVPVGSWDESVFWITNCKGFAASWVAMKDAPLARPLTYALSAALLMNDMAKAALHTRCQDIRIDLLEAFDERFDQFWTALRKQKAKSLLAVRTREVLQWHFKYSLQRKQVWILASFDGVELTAYAIFCRQDNAEYGLRRMRLVDFQALNGSTTMLMPMLECALKRCEDEELHMLEWIGIAPHLRRLIDGLCPYQRHLPSWLYYYTATNKDIAARLANPEMWNPTCLDGDLSL